MDSCEKTTTSSPRTNFTRDSSTESQPEEEADSCGELPVGGSMASTAGAGGAQIHRRCSEFYPPGAAPPRGVTVLGVGAVKQGRRDRRQSDPGRLEVPLLRVSLHGDPSNGERCLQPGVRLSDPRLDAIRSLLASGPCEVGEALPTTNPPSSSPPLHRASLPLRSRSPAADSKSRQARWDSRRLSLPTPAPLASPPLWPRRASGSGGAGGSWLPGEMGEAMGAVSGTPTGEYPSGSPPPRPSPISTAVCEQTAAAAAAGAALRRRRSVSLDQSSRLEAISEENASLAAAALKARIAEQLQSSD